MGVSDNIRGMVDDQATMEEDKKQLSRDFNKGAMNLMNTFLKRVENGSFSLDSVKDYKDLYGMYVELNEINFGEETSGGIPELSTNQALALEKHVLVKSRNVADERGNIKEEKYIDMDALDEMGVDDVNDTIKSLGEALNKDNLEAYNE